MSDFVHLGLMLATIGLVLILVVMAALFRQHQEMKGKLAKALSENRVLKQQAEWPALIMYCEMFGQYEGYAIPVAVSKNGIYAPTDREHRVIVPINKLDQKNRPRAPHWDPVNAKDQLGREQVIMCDEIYVVEQEESPFDQTGH